MGTIKTLSIATPKRMISLWPCVFKLGGNPLQLL
jgi:hypothetical protein